MTTQIEITNFTATAQDAILANVNPRISSITYPSGSSVSTTGGQTVTVTGSNFLVGVSIYIDTTPAPSITRVSSTSLTFTTPAKTAGTKALYVMNSTGRVSEYFHGITYS